MSNLLLTVRFLDHRYHGLLTRNGPPEWPPAPYRLFQALVAGVGRCGELDAPAGDALGWLQRLSPPIIIAPNAKEGQGITRFVPNNDGDKKFDRQERLTAKPTIPTLMLLGPDDKAEVHYAWEVGEHASPPLDDIRRAARTLTCLGWGIDMAFADARPASTEEIQSLKGVRWYPKPGVWRDRGMLRTPKYDPANRECTLCDLRRCHESAMNRIEHGKPLRTVEKPKVFESVLYTSVERPIGLPHAVFRLVDSNDDTCRYSHAKLIHIAGMTRHAALQAMTPWCESDEQRDWLCRFVRGKRDKDCADEHKQLSYIPLPSIGHEHADAMIRNVMIVAPLDCESELRHVCEQLDGVELRPEGEHDSCETESKPGGEVRMRLERFRPPPGKFIDKCYLGTSKTWHTVTPVILDGHNKKSKTDKPEAIARETEKLICKALRRAEIETPCEFTWQTIPFLKNCLSAHKYDGNGRHTGYHRPIHLKHLTAVHVRLTFTHPVPGPLVIGAGRHCGFGLFAAERE